MGGQTLTVHEAAPVQIPVQVARICTKQDGYAQHAPTGGQGLGEQEDGLAIQTPTLQECWMIRVQAPVALQQFPTGGQGFGEQGRVADQLNEQPVWMRITHVPLLAQQLPSGPHGVGLHATPSE